MKISDALSKFHREVCGGRGHTDITVCASCGVQWPCRTMAICDPENLGVLYRERFGVDA